MTKNMNKKILVAVIVIAILAVGGIKIKGNKPTVIETPAIEQVAPVDTATIVPGP